MQPQTTRGLGREAVSPCCERSYGARGRLARWCLISWNAIASRGQVGRAVQRRLHRRTTVARHPDHAGRTDPCGSPESPAPARRPARAPALQLHEYGNEDAMRVNVFQAWMGASLVLIAVLMAGTVRTGRLGTYVGDGGSV